MENNAYGMPAPMNLNVGDGNGDDGWKFLWPFLLMGGRGFGGWGGGYGGYGGGGGGCGPCNSYAGFNNADSPTNANVLGVSRQLEDNARSGQFNTLLAQMNNQQLNNQQNFASLCQQIAACCCDLRQEVACVNTSIALQGKDIEKAICDQTGTLTAQATANTQAILNAITDSRIETLQAQLLDAKLGNQNNVIVSNISNSLSPMVGETLSLERQILAAMQNNHHPHGNGGGPPGPPK